MSIKKENRITICFLCAILIGISSPFISKALASYPLRALTIKRQSNGRTVITADDGSKMYLDSAGAMGISVEITKKVIVVREIGMYGSSMIITQ